MVATLVIACSAMEERSTLVHCCYPRCFVNKPESDNWKVAIRLCSRDF